MPLDPVRVDQALRRISAHRREGMTDAVHRFLVTPKSRAPLDLRAATAAFTNWLEERGEAWLVMVMGVHEESFLAAARSCGWTVEEIEDSGPGTGWTKEVKADATQAQE